MWTWIEPILRAAVPVLVRRAGQRHQPLRGDDVQHEREALGEAVLCTCICACTCHCARPPVHSPDASRTACSPSHLRAHRISGPSHGGVSALHSSVQRHSKRPLLSCCALLIHPPASTRPLNDPGHRAMSKRALDHRHISGTAHHPCPPLPTPPASPHLPRPLNPSHLPPPPAPPCACPSG